VLNAPGLAIARSLRCLTFAMTRAMRRAAALKTSASIAWLGHDFITS
jgi:hypothetical protein